MRVYFYYTILFLSLKSISSQLRGLAYPSSSPSSSPTIFPNNVNFTLSPSEESSCEACSNDAPFWMMWSGKDCTTSSAVYTECRNSLSWSKKNYCQLSCYNAGLGYDGDQCCTSTSPTLSPTQESSCEFCSNDAPFWLIWKGKDCTTSSDVYTECSNSWYWSINNYCQESCYKAGLGYDGDNCCTSTSTSPTLSPTSESTSSCELCSNDAPFWMYWKGKDCDTSSDLQCSNSWYWSQNKYCQHSCYKAGLGYDGDVCCDATF